MCWGVVGTTEGGGGAITSTTLTFSHSAFCTSADVCCVVPVGVISLHFTTEAALVSRSAVSSYWLRWVIKMILPTLGHVNLFTSCWLALLHYDRFVNKEFTANITTSSSYYDVPQWTHRENRLTKPSMTDINRYDLAQVVSGTLIRNQCSVNNCYDLA